MDANHFDTLAKQLAAPTTRRATLSAAAAGGLLSALGLRRAAPEALAAQKATCLLAFATSVRLGPSVDQALTANGSRPGELRGELSFSLSRSGALEDAALTLPGGASLPVVGQATGNSLQLRIELAPRVALVAVGVGEREVSACQGAIDGLTTGPEVGDLGDWHAAVVQQSTLAGAVSQGGAAASSASRGQSGRTGANGRDGSTAQTLTAGRNTCASGLTPCGNACVDLGTDRNHCGACGEVCPDIGGLVCAGERCGCPAGWTDCSQAPGAPQGIDGYCANLDSDTGNCGACGFSCAPSETCANRKCRGTGTSSAQCASGLTECDGVCVDLTSNMSHCGACNAACESGLVPVACRSGVCERASCAVGQEYCGAVDGCRDLQSDPDHCGTCQRRCPSGACSDGFCANSRATCPSGQADCGEGCTDLSSNDFHCGACGNGCDVGQVCQGGVCTGATCTGGLTDCAGSCVDLQSNPFHCGVCGTVCPGAETDANPCIAGNCVDQCTAHGLGNCPGGCRDLSSDPAHCGACGNDCQGGSCISGVCTGGAMQCTSGLTDCGGVCVNTTTDAVNCGACGLECAFGESCSAGACQSSCAAGLSYCNGVCVDTGRDPGHCGFCNNPCGGFSECVSGSCISTAEELPGAELTCAAIGLTDCGGVCVDLLTDDLNCGSCENNCTNMAGYCDKGDGMCSVCSWRIGDPNPEPRCTS